MAYTPMLLLSLAGIAIGSTAEPVLVRSVRSGAWSSPATWEGERVPAPGERVQIRTGHQVTYDTRIDKPIRSIHIAGTLTFDPEQDTLLTVGLIKIQSGDDPSETGFECEAMNHHGTRSHAVGAALEVGTFAKPVSPKHSALIRLAYVEGLDPTDCPAIVCCGGRMEFHGAPVDPTWVKLGAMAKPGDTVVTLAEPIRGWKPGDRVIVTATRHVYSRNSSLIPKVSQHSETEQLKIKEFKEKRLLLDHPLAYPHAGEGDMRGEVALLSRNVVVESADPDGIRGHTMYHHNSQGSIRYAEFRHLGKKGKLGKYSLHFHRVADTMRGASVVGASIWDSQNRWITIHGTNNLVVKDCVGYRSIGHGFFLEDGTEVDNILDHNLAVNALEGTPLPDQVLAYDGNEGAGFWWANCRNAFTRNVAVECDQYGFRYQVEASPNFDPRLIVRSTDGTHEKVDIRTLPFIRFESNEGHALPRGGFNLGGGPGEGQSGGVAGVGPDNSHPFVVRDLRLWETHWGFTPGAPATLVDTAFVKNSDFALWRPVFDRQAYRGLSVNRCRWPFFHERGVMPTEASFPGVLKPSDDRPPVTVVTEARTLDDGTLLIRGVTVDDEAVKRVNVNHLWYTPSRPQDPLVAWEVTLTGLPRGRYKIWAWSEDRAGNVEKIPHKLETQVGK